MRIYRYFFIIKITGDYLGCHDPLSLLYEVTLGTLAISVLAGSLVSLQPGDHSVVTTASTLGSPQRVLAVHDEVLKGTVTEGKCWGASLSLTLDADLPASHWSLGRSSL